MVQTGEVSALSRRGLAVIVAVFLPFALGVSPAAVRAGHDPAHFLSILSQRAVAELTEPGLDAAEKGRRFRGLIGEGFDIPAIGRFVLGRYWRHADAQTQEAFLRAFEDMIVSRFSPLFDNYGGEQIVVGAAVPFGTNGEFFAVSSHVERVAGEPIAVNWRVHRVGQGFKIVDIIAEGVSIAVTLRSEYGSVLRNNGGDVGRLVEELRARLSAL